MCQIQGMGDPNLFQMLSAVYGRGKTRSMKNGGCDVFFRDNIWTGVNQR